ncbi:MAG: outer membrane lipoprotein-sorting protein [Chthoniobacterales bacterium]
MTRLRRLTHPPGCLAAVYPAASQPAVFPSPISYLRFDSFAPAHSPYGLPGGSLSSGFPASCIPISYLILAAFFSTTFFLTATNATSSPEAILQEARIQPTLRPLLLYATIRGAEEPLPLTIKIDHGVIHYQLTNPNELITLKLSPIATSLHTTVEANESSINEARRYQEIRNSGVTYDDLSLAFLYWPHPHLLRTEIIRGEKTWLLELISPASNSIYGSAHVWIDQQSSALLRMEGFNHDGRLLKRFEVISAQKIDNLWMLKEMRIETFDPATQKVIQRSYLDIGKLKG